MGEEYPLYPLFRVTTFGRFLVEQLVSVSPEQSPCYEPIAEQIWRSRFAACDILKFLLCRAQRRAPKDVLIEAFWPDAEVTSAYHSFDTAISRLRSILTSQGKESLLVTKRVSNTIFYELPFQQTLWTDVDAFLAYLSQADQAISQGRDPLQSLEGAWRYASNVFLEDNLYTPWTQARRQTINVSRHRVLRQLVNLYIQRNRVDQAENLLLAALEEEPMDEDSVCRLMILLEQQGRRQEALHCYNLLEMTLKEECDTEPLVSTRVLAERLRQAPAASLSSSAAFEAEIDIHVTATPRGISEPTLFTVTVPLIATNVPQQLSLSSSWRTSGEFSSEKQVSPFIAPQEGSSSDMLLYRIIKEICYWTGREGSQYSLPIIVDRLIKELDTMEQPHMPAEGVLSRRDALLVIAGLPLTLLARIQTGSLPSTLLEEFLAQCAASLATCWHLLKGTEFQQVGSLLLRYLPELEKLACQPSKYQKYSANLAAQGHLLAATLALHQNNLPAREVHCKQAVRLGQIAEDVNLHMTSLKWLAVTYYYAKRPSRALQVYQEIEPFLDQVSPLLRGSVSIKMAGTYAQCGKEQDALRCIQMAHAAFPEHPEHDPCFLYADCGLPTLPIWEGLAYLDLGQSQEAWDALERVEHLAATITLSERARVEAINHQAEAAIALNDQERFRTYIEMGTTGAIALGSEKRYNEALDVYRQARVVWSREPRIKELQDLFVR